MPNQFKKFRYKYPKWTGLFLCLICLGCLFGVAYIANLFISPPFVKQIWLQVVLGIILGLILGLIGRFLLKFIINLVKYKPTLAECLEFVTFKTSQKKVNNLLKKFKINNQVENNQSDNESDSDSNNIQVSFENKTLGARQSVKMLCGDLKQNILMKITDIRSKKYRINIVSEDKPSESVNLMSNQAYQDQAYQDDFINALKNGLNDIETEFGIPNSLLDFIPPNS